MAGVSDHDFKQTTCGTDTGIRQDKLTHSVEPRDQFALPKDFYACSSTFGYLQTLPTFAAFAALLYGVGIGSPVVSGLCAIGAALLGYRMTFIIHDCSHHTLFAKRWENEVFGWFTSSLLFTDFRVFRKLHWIHHRRFRYAEDPQGSDYNGLVPGRDKVLLHLLKPLFFFNVIEKLGIFNARTCSGMTPDELALNNEASRPVSQSSAKRFSALTCILVAQIGIALIATNLGVRWWGYPLFLSLVVSLGLFVSRVRSYLEHGSLDPSQSERRIARTHLSNWLERNVFAGFLFNYHNEHHRWPQVPSRMLPRVYREVTVGKLPSWDVSQSYWASLRQLIASCRHREPQVAQFLSQAPKIAEQEVCCGLCGANDGKPYADSYDYEYQTCSNRWRFVRCLNCDNVYLNPRPDTNELSTIYPPTYYAYHYDKINPLARRVKEWMDRRTFAAIRMQLGRPVQNYLDIGCGNGRYLRSMEAAGLSSKQIYGIELDEQQVAHVREQGFQVQCCRFEDAQDLPNGQFDLITLFSVLEHTAEPRQILKRAHDLLSPGGMLVFEVPNADSLNASWFRDRFWGGYHTPRHWNLFSQSVLEQIVPDLGYSIQRIRMTPGHAFWLWSLHHVVRYGWGWDRPGRWLNPSRCLAGLMLVTPVDLLRGAMSGRTDNMLVFLRKETAASITTPNRLSRAG